MQVTVHLHKLHPIQQRIKDNRAKRKIIRGGRRGGKTVLASDESINGLLDGHRVLYAVPVSDQLQKWWHEVKVALAEPIAAGIYVANETMHTIEKPGTENRVRGKTAWNADTLRGDYADKLILDEYQMMSDDTWQDVGSPMLLDHDGDAIFIYTPPSARTIHLSRAKDKRHAAKMFTAATNDKSGRWAAFHFSSHENPYISEIALSEITKDMSRLSYEQEIMALDKEKVIGALWDIVKIDELRIVGDAIKNALDLLPRVVVAIDPSSTSNKTSDECGISVVGRGRDEHGYVIADYSKVATPGEWATLAIAAFCIHGGDIIVGEANNGGDMIETVLRSITKSAVEAQLYELHADPSLAVSGENIPYKKLWAARGKETRAEPVSALYEQNKVHHVGTNLNELEDEMCNWMPNSAKSPNRIDALVWGMTELSLVGSSKLFYED